MASIYTMNFGFSFLLGLYLLIALGISSSLRNWHHHNLYLGNLLLQYTDEFIIHLFIE